MGPLFAVFLTALIFSILCFLSFLTTTVLTAWLGRKSAGVSSRVTADIPDPAGFITALAQLIDAISKAPAQYVALLASIAFLGIAMWAAGSIH
jgi:small neutral amino acid transporter SnatA (MarC family)